MDAAFDNVQLQAKHTCPKPLMDEWSECCWATGVDS